MKLVTRGEYFGELALLSTNSRAATATVERGGAFILSLTKEDFDTHMGSLARELSQQAKDEYGVAVYDDKVANDPARSLAAKAMTDLKLKPCWASARSARFCCAGIRAARASSR